jgi:DNA-binding NtrC family response regulator
MKKILIVDENRFSRICSAILENEGFETEILENGATKLATFDKKKFGLVITSYPFGCFLFEKIKDMNLPTIILTDHINRAFVNLLEGFSDSYCMLKPLDYQEFRSLVRQLASCEVHEKNEFSIL